MAQHGRVHVFDISLTQGEREVAETMSLRLVRHPSEPVAALVLRLLAYCLEFRDGIELVGGARRPDLPAIRIRDFGGRTLAWIDVGLPDAARLRRALRDSGLVIVYAATSLAAMQRHVVGLGPRRTRRVALVALDEGLVTRLAGLVKRRTRLEMTVAGREIFLRVDRVNLSGGFDTTGWTAPCAIGRSAAVHARRGRAPAGTRGDPPASRL